MSLVATILGCGSSGGVPRVGYGWGACDPAEPRNRRRRCSLLVQRHGEAGTTTVLVDTGPDLRMQLLDAGVEWVDGVLYTHEHADHTHGIDDLRVLAIFKRRLVDVYADDSTATLLRARFAYCFATPPGSQYPPILTLHGIAPLTPVTIEGPGGPITALPFLQRHGDIDSLGFRFEGLAYSSDANDLPEDSVAALEDLDVWIIDALRPAPHPSHWSVEEALGWVDRVRPARAVLTNMHTDLDYATLAAELPEGVEPAYDGMTITIS
jgi:phosphoribosyl 1,2-cyclic phosphate phosphodiesterase